MKKTQKIFKIILFCVSFFVIFNFFVINKKTNSININFCKSSICVDIENNQILNKNAKKLKNNIYFNNLNLKKLTVNNNQDRCYSFFYEGKIYDFKLSDFKDKIKFSEVQAKILNNEINQNEVIDFLVSLNLTEKEICFYLRPELKIIIEELAKKINVDPTDDFVQVVKNECKINFDYGEEGKFINQEKFFNSIFKQIKENQNKICLSVETEAYKNTQSLELQFVEKGCFSTNFSTSSEARKNNIKVALSKFDGLVLDKGEVLSFNQTTGVRNKESGYQEAKIISGGSYIEGYGGGVCQVSTTLYNAALLSDLEILEVHSHSLPVGYVEPSFDAMVNIGSSDLRIRNNTNGKIIITTSYKNDVCKVKIFGEKNKYKITRISEKIKVIPASEDVIETDYKKFNLEDLDIGEEKRVSYSKDGFYSNGYLNYYDSDGTLIKTKKIRQNKYNATQGIIVKRES